MARITGIQIEYDAKGRPAYVRFNLKKRPEIIEYLYKIGAIDNNDFEMLSKRRISRGKLLESVNNQIDKLSENDNS